MSEFDVKFVIEAQNLGDATNRAMVALYKGDLDAREVSVVSKDGNTFKFADNPNTGQDIGIVKRDPGFLHQGKVTVPGVNAGFPANVSTGLPVNVVDINSKRK